MKSFKKNLYSREDNSSSDEDDSDSKRVLFMDKETKKITLEIDEEEGEEDLEEKLISALTELNKERKKKPIIQSRKNLLEKPT
jgi:hypothetical protein